MPYKQHTEAEQIEFVDLASEIGISPAMRQLGYPRSYNTAKKWFAELNKEVPKLDALMQQAADMKKFYGDAEKKVALQNMMDRIVEELHSSKLDSESINKLANALEKTIRAFQLVEGKATNINESHSKDGSDLAIRDMLNEALAKNNVAEAKLNS